MGPGRFCRLRPADSPWFALVLGFEVSKKSRNALFGEVPKHRRQLGGTNKLGFSKKQQKQKHIFGGFRSAAGSSEGQKSLDTRTGGRETCLKNKAIILKMDARRLA